MTLTQNKFFNVSFVFFVVYFQKVHVIAKQSFNKDKV